jgi:putative membrane protein
MTRPGEPIRSPSLPWTVASGLLIGGADAVPGVSGGTVALILGLWDRLIEGIATFLAVPTLVRSAEGRTRILAAARFLLPLGLGIVASYYLGTLLLVGPEESPGLLRRFDTAPVCFAFFSGLVIASLWEPWRRIKKRTAVHWALALLGAAVAWWVSGLPFARTAPPTWALVYGGALAIGFMLLPGVSGSLLLLVLGQYTVVTGAIHDHEWGKILVFLGGVMLGFAVFVPLLRALVRRHHDLTMAALTGLMAGSLRALWPWKTNYDPRVGTLTNVGVGDHVPAAVAALLLGAVASMGLAWIETRLREPQGSPPAAGGAGTAAAP